MDNRLQDLLLIIPEESQALVMPTLEEVVFLELRLQELKKLPFIKINPNNPEMQKSTPASKMYKELLQQYINCIKMIESVIYRDNRLDSTDAEESPLRKWFKENTKDGFSK